MSTPLVEVRGLTKHFTRGGGLFQKGTVVKAVDGVSFSIDEGETFGLVGESGSGKSTTGRCMLRLVEPTAGEVRYAGDDVLAFSSSRMRAARRHMQMIFQDPYSSLNPRMKARDSATFCHCPVDSSLPPRNQLPSWVAKPRSSFWMKPMAMPLRADSSQRLSSV